MRKRTNGKIKQPFPFRVRGRMWIDGPEGTFLGYGRVVLLERIRDCGSISAAARSMEMSYRHAWELVDSMNRQSRRPVVKTNAGGRGGGGTVLTPAGESAIAEFHRLNEAFRIFLEQKTTGLGDRIETNHP